MAGFLPSLAARKNRKFLSTGENNTKSSIKRYIMSKQRDIPECLVELIQQSRYTVKTKKLLKTYNRIKQQQHTIRNFLIYEISLKFDRICYLFTWRKEM